jgi:hypothetical protein
VGRRHRIALGNDPKSFGWAFCMISGALHGVEVLGDGHWYPVIPWVRDDGFYAVGMREPMPFRDACHLFGFDIPAGKPSVPKRIKRDVARGLTSLFGDLIQIAGTLPTGQIKAHCLNWDVAYDLVVLDIKKELQAWNGQVYLSVLNELHGSPANLDVQTASNLDLAKVRDHNLIQYLCQEFACDVFELMRDDKRVKEEMRFYNPSGRVNACATRGARTGVSRFCAPCPTIRRFQGYTQWKTGAIRLANSSSMQHKRWIFGNFLGLNLAFLDAKTSSFCTLQKR